MLACTAFWSGDDEAARREIASALRINPNYAEGYGFMKNAPWVVVLIWLLGAGAVALFLTMKGRYHHED